MNTPAVQDDSVLAALADADPGDRLSISEDTSLRMVRAAVAASAPRPRRRLAVVVIASAALTLGLPAGALASGYVAQTGWFGSPNPGSPAGTTPFDTESDGSEWIDIAAPDYVQFARGIWPAYAALPDGYVTDDLTAAIAQRTVSQNGGESALRQVTGIVSEFEQYARCTWRAEWLTADSIGDATRTSRAAEVLREAAEWPATIAADGGGIVDGELVVANAAAEGDRARVDAANAWCDALLEGVGQ